MTAVEKRANSVETQSLPDPEAMENARPLAGRWLIWSVLAIAYFIAIFHRVALGVVADRLMAEFQVNGTVVGMLASVYFYLYAIMQLPSGAMADALGARKTVTGGAALAGIGSLVFALAPALEAAYLGRFLVGLGVSVMFVAALKFQVSWFRAAEFGTVSGLLVLVGNLGSVAATTPVAWISQSMGWRASFLVIGFITCAVAGAAWRWVRDQPSETELPAPASAGASHATLATSISWRAIPESARAVLRNRQTRAGFLAHFGTVGAFLTFSGLWAVPYLMHVYGMDRSEAANYLLVASLGIVVSGPLVGYVSDRLLKSRRLPILFMALLATGSWLAMAFWDGGKPPAWALYPLFGALGFSCSLATLVLTSVKEANPPRLAGLAIGTANGGFLGAALLQPAMGYLLDSRWQGVSLEGARVYPQGAYQIALVIISALSLVGLLGAALMHESYGQVVAEE